MKEPVYSTNIEEYIKKVEWNTEGSTLIHMVDANIGVRPQ